MYSPITIKPGREKSVLNRHPWLFSGAIQDAGTSQSGDIVAVRSAKGETLGYGFFDSDSQISVRLFEFGNKEEPDFGQYYWSEKLDTALLLRKQLVSGPDTNAYRLVHAEGDGLPGLIADVYDGQVVYQILIPGTLRIEPLIRAAFETLGFANPYRQGIKEDGTATLDKEILENGLRFLVDYGKGQKTGFFLDQRENRKLLQKLSSGKKVLNAFGYTGGFSVYARAGGAVSVTTLDISEDAIGMAEGNYKMNFADDCHKGVVADCFDYLRQLPESYDIIVLDPPAFAKSAKAVDRAARGYKDINIQAMKSLPPGGMLFTFTCSQHISRDLFRKIVFAAAADSGREVVILYQLSQPPDHPVNIYHPEGEYLKGLVLQVK